MLRMDGMTRKDEVATGQTILSPRPAKAENRNEKKQRNLKRNQN
jgi:hypothetical protein